MPLRYSPKLREIQHHIPLELRQHVCSSGAHLNFATDFSVLCDSCTWHFPKLREIQHHIPLELRRQVCSSGAHLDFATDFSLLCDSCT
ncbi:hypothetical protein T4D_12106 [Trichinella pseudospiralis]|uniref:Uncharacterized protein n=1 Tax=Trichinella pseudospiralis TaxID=6337 RepID=A0A0V1F4J6_TRIPS|nr:hypothetical protein T4D_12106 [Trichinella pseudospiralis]